MATQASAITFISTTAQAYVDGMRFVQFYFGLPLAMVILSATAVPIFHRARVYTAYEYLEHRFDAKTRLLVTIIFLISRGLGAGLALSAPAIVLSVVLGWPFRVTILIMGALVVLYTTLGGIKAVTWADVQQMTVILLALIMAFAVAISMLPKDVSFLDAVRLAGAAGKLNAVTTDVRLERSIQHLERPHRRHVPGAGLLRNRSESGTALPDRKIHRPKSPGTAAERHGESAHAVLYLFIGAMVFVVFLFVRPPLVFQPVVMEQVQASPQYAAIESRYEQAFDQRQIAARRIMASDPLAPQDFRAAQSNLDAARADALKLSGTSDTNYIFLSFVTNYLPSASSAW
jgi:Na+(H+)/acetate symporter ActP